MVFKQRYQKGIITRDGHKFAQLHLLCLEMVWFRNIAIYVAPFSAICWNVQHRREDKVHIKCTNKNTIFNSSYIYALFVAGSCYGIDLACSTLARALLLHIPSCRWKQNMVEQVQYEAIWLNDVLVVLHAQNPCFFPTSYQSRVGLWCVA